MLTISDYLPQLNTSCTSSIKLDTKGNNIKFSIETDSKTNKNEAIENATTYNNEDIGKLEDNQETTEKATDSSKTQETHNGVKTEDKDNSKPETDDIIPVKEYETSVDSLLKEVTENIEQKRESGLAKLLDGSEDNEVLPLNTEIIETDEIQGLLQQRDEMHQRLKSILSGKSQDLIGINTDLQKEFVETITNNIGGEVVNADSLLLKNESTIITEEIQKNISEANTGRIFSDIKDVAQVNDGENNNETQTGITGIIGNKEILPENMLENRDGENTGGSKSQQGIGEEGPEKIILSNESMTKEKSGEDKTNENKLFTKESAQSLNDLDKNSDINKLNMINVQNFTKQTKELTDPASNENISTRIKADFPQNNSQTVTVEQTISYTDNVRVDNYVRQNSASEVTDSVGKQILESIQSSISNPVGDKQITVRLNPPELGEVLIKFQEQENQITGLLEVNKTQTRAEIEQALPQIIRNLSDSGIDIKRLEVVLTNSEHQEQETLNEHSLFNSQQQQHNFDDSGMYEYDRDRTAIHEWLSNGIGYDKNSELQGALTVDSSINILI